MILQRKRAGAGVKAALQAPLEEKAEAAADPVLLIGTFDGVITLFLYSWRIYIIIQKNPSQCESRDQI